MKRENDNWKIKALERLHNIDLDADEVDFEDEVEDPFRLFSA